MVLSAKGGVRPGTDRSKSLTYSVTDVLLLAVDEAEDLLLLLAADKCVGEGGERESDESAAEAVVSVTEENADVAIAAESAIEGSEDWHIVGARELVGVDELGDGTTKLEVWRLRLRFLF